MLAQDTGESFEQTQKRLIAGLVNDIKSGKVGVGSPVLKHIIIDSHERQKDSEVNTDGVQS